MDRASVYPFPSSRTLAGWWRHLHPVRPSSLRVGYWHLHRIEAPVRTIQVRRLDPLGRHLMQALSLQGADPECQRSTCVQRLQDRLRLPATLIQQTLRTLEQLHLVDFAAGRGWKPTELGRHALEEGEYPRGVEERRLFPFVERLDAAGQRLGPPHFMSVAECPGTAWTVAEELRFDPGVLVACLGQAASWKQSVGFPADVQHLELDNNAAVEGVSSDAALPWQRVLIDRPERVFLALVTTSSEDGPTLLGFACQTESWTLLSDTPVLTLPGGFRHLGAELYPAPGEDEVREAWRAWGRQRNLPTSEVAACQVTLRGDHVDVRASDRLVQRLQAARSDIFKGEAWLLVGHGLVRTAAAIQIESAVVP